MHRTTAGEFLLSKGQPFCWVWFGSPFRATFLGGCYSRSPDRFRSGRVSAWRVSKAVPKFAEVQAVRAWAQET